MRNGDCVILTIGYLAGTDHVFDRVSILVPANVFVKRKVDHSGIREKRLVFKRLHDDAGFSEPVGFTLEYQDVRTVSEPIQKRRCEWHRGRHRSSERTQDS